MRLHAALDGGVRDRFHFECLTKSRSGKNKREKNRPASAHLFSPGRYDRRCEFMTAILLPRDKCFTRGNSRQKNFPIARQNTGSVPQVRAVLGSNRFHGNLRASL